MGPKSRTDRKTYVLNAAFAILVGAAFVFPRFVTRRNEGFASGASATIAFLGLLAVAALVGLYQAWDTTRRRSQLAARERWLGYLPAVIGVGAIVALVAFLRH